MLLSCGLLGVFSGVASKAFTVCSLPNVSEVQFVLATLAANGVITLLLVGLGLWGRRASASPGA